MTASLIGRPLRPPTLAVDSCHANPLSDRNIYRNLAIFKERGGEEKIQWLLQSEKKTVSIQAFKIYFFMFELGFLFSSKHWFTLS
ncbi:hypothetical protein L1987_14690 [Smallanthus sonchifolius]|uniref:Uncharacterized protein n=1 Tax=Smallanthus sonchifolius TaxID=185202 RepID=A0ACB9J528_9ASTR|nr:hypothetical protein L1987_14690 [Smallanthus sonchifolius]